MKVAIYSRGLEEKQDAQLNILLQELKKYNIEFLLFIALQQNYVSDGEIFSTWEDLDDSIDFLISLGGDGTMLDAVALVREYEIRRHLRRFGGLAT